MKEPPAKRSILVVENNVEHVRIIEEVFAENSLDSQVIVLADGKAAISYLRGEGAHEQAARPDLILLDLDLPERDGRELLAEIKADAQLRRIPVVVLTTSASKEDILQAYTLQGNCYVVKSFDLTELSRIVKRIQEFWLEIVTLPLE